jgi:ADP-ribose pyrophosphatase
LTSAPTRDYLRDGSIIFFREASMRARCNQVRSLHRGRVFELRRENITLANGHTTDIDVIRHPGAAAILPVDAAGRIYLLRQFRYAVGQDIWEIPAGTLEKGESPQECARRELIEETGVAASRWDRLGTITPLPGYSDEVIHLFLARDLTPAQAPRDPDEMIAVSTLALDQAVAMIHAGEIRDAKTIAGICLAHPLLR